MIVRRRQFLTSVSAVASVRLDRSPAAPAGAVTLFLCGDVMTGRGIDQVLPHPSPPRLYEPVVASAVEYVQLAERLNGPLPRPVGFDYVWGDALPELQARSPDLRIINLETSVTTSDTPLPKGINYRMHPRNVPCLHALRPDCCVLANNHILDWGKAGLLETLDTLRDAGLTAAGAGRNAEEAMRPSAHVTARGRILVFGLGSPTAGVPPDWAAAEGRPGLYVLTDLSPHTADRVVGHIAGWKRPGDRVVASIHWGSNWGYAIPREQRDFAHRLVENGVVDVVHGHSSHHPRGIEVHRGRLVLHGCGDFLNDYEGIAGYDEFRSELVLAFFATVDASGQLTRLEMTPFKTRRFRLERVRGPDAAWLRQTLDRECRRLGTAVEPTGDGELALRWS